MARIVMVSSCCGFAGDELPACSALFLPIYDPADPFTRHRASGAPLPCAVLEVLVCKTAQTVHNHSDLMHAVCHVMDHYKVRTRAPHREIPYPVLQRCESKDCSGKLT